MRKKSSTKKVNIFDEIKVVRDEEGDMESLDEIEEEDDDEENIQGLRILRQMYFTTHTFYSMASYNKDRQ